MDIAFFDVFNPVPINSGGDWYRYYLLDEIGRSHDVIGYYNVSEKIQEGICSPKLNSVPITRIHYRLEESIPQLRNFPPEFMFRNKVIGIY